MQRLSLFIISAMFGYSSSVVAETDGLLGGWSGLRSNAEAAGISPSIVYTAEYAKPTQGGDDNAGVFMGNIDVTADIDLAALMSLRGARLFVYLIGNHSHASGNGDFLGDKVGSAQAISNIEAPTAAKLYEFWYEQHFLDAWSVRTGLYDLNSEFDVIESAGTLINSSFGIGADFSQTGENGPSIFPVTSLAIRLRYEGADGGYAQFALFDGVPGDPENARGTHVQLGDGDGVLEVVEGGFTRNAASEQRFYKVALGLWQYNPEQPALTTDDFAAPTAGEDNRGGYVLAEYQLMQEHSDPAQGVALFLRHGVAESGINAIDRYTGLGLCWTGVFAGRDEDQFVIGVADARFGDEFIAAEHAAQHVMSRHERIYEISYRAQVTPWFALQPDLQFIEDPAFNTASSMVTVALLRAEFVL